jgi:hypothetical protein
MRRCTDRPNEHGGDVPDQFYDGGGESQAHEYVDGAHQHVRHLFFKPEKVHQVFIYLRKYQIQIIYSIHCAETKFYKQLI